MIRKNASQDSVFVLGKESLTHVVFLKMGICGMVVTNGGVC